MEMGILGFPKAGKTTLFNLLTDSRQETGKFSAPGKANVGVATVPDPRLEQLRDLFQPRRYTPATVSFVDIPGIRSGESAESLDLARLRDADALMHVVRAFADDEIPHADGSVDPQRDIANLDLELIVADMELVGRRIERLDKARKRGLSRDEESERALLADMVLPALEAETPVRELDLAADQEKRLRGFQLLSAKPLVIALNVDEGRLATADPATLGVREGVPALVVSAPIEEEIAHLDGDEQREFLAELGHAEPSVHRIIRASYEMLGLISFFTVGEDEVRAWTVRHGTEARRAAGAIHTDLERGFIRAEVVPWDDLLARQSLAACRQEGVLRLEGKSYVTRDGDIMHIRSGV
jgi:GTP-binding protein YchF